SEPPAHPLTGRGSPDRSGLFGVRLWSGPRGRRRDAEDAADVRDRLATPPLAPPEFGPRVGRNRRRFTPPPARRSGVRVDRVVDVRQQQLGPGPTPPVPATAHRRDGRRVLR